MSTEAAVDGAMVPFWFSMAPNNTSTDANNTSNINGNISTSMAEMPPSSINDFFQFGAQTSTEACANWPPSTVPDQCNTTTTTTTGVDASAGLGFLFADSTRMEEVPPPPPPPPSTLMAHDVDVLATCAPTLVEEVPTASTTTPTTAAAASTTLHTSSSTSATPVFDVNVAPCEEKVPEEVMRTCIRDVPAHNNIIAPPPSCAGTASLDGVLAQAMELLELSAAQEDGAAAAGDASSSNNNNNNDEAAHSDGRFTAQSTLLVRRVEEARDAALEMICAAQQQLTHCLIRASPHDELAAALGDDVARTPLPAALPRMIAALKELLVEE